MNNTLYLVQSPALTTPAILEKLQQVYEPEDHVVFFGEAISILSKDAVSFYSNYYCLSFEQELLNPELVSGMVLLDYSGFADLVLKFERCISFK